MALALEGIKVVDITQYAAGPMGARLLADLGADVIHIEPPEKRDGMRFLEANINRTPGRIPTDVNPLWEHNNRNKRGIALDISQERGQEILYKLLARSDVLVSSLRPYELERYKIDYNTLHQLHPRLICANLSGYGQKGPEKNEPGYDTTSYWARAGIPYRLTGPGMLSPVFTTAFGDNVGGMHLAYAIMTALYVRERTGMG